MTDEWDNQTSKPTHKPDNEIGTVDSGMFDFFKVDLKTQIATLNEGLLKLERKEGTPDTFESLMRAAHSIKGAARVVQLTPLVKLSHALEDCFIAAKKEMRMLTAERVDILLQAIDLINSITDVDTEALKSWFNSNRQAINELTVRLDAIAKGEAVSTAEEPIKKEPAALPPETVKKVIEKTLPPELGRISDRVLRVTAKNLNRLMGLAGETLIESSWLSPFAISMYKLKRENDELNNQFEILRDLIDQSGADEKTKLITLQMQHQLSDNRKSLNTRISELEIFIRRHNSISKRIYQEVIDIRMRPFEDGLESFPRMVRDLARQLGKQVRLEIIGSSTSVDREILERLESPLSHLLRNAVDHGIETPAERLAAGKPEEGVIKLEASHRAGMLAITVSDDGRGVDYQLLKQKIIARSLAKPELIATLSHQELLDFLYLPGFTTKDKATEISGRGFGLDVVRTMVQEVGGVIRTYSEEGKGLTVNLQLPLTLSVMRCLLVDIAGEPYAFPLSRIERALFVPKTEIHYLEKRQFIRHRDQNIGLVYASQILELRSGEVEQEMVPVVIISDRINAYGIIVDKFIGERELVVQEMDLQFGKIPDIYAGAFREDGSPLLIIDVDDLVNSINKYLSVGTFKHISERKHEEVQMNLLKRILIVDDSITVREVESRLLKSQGYEVETAVNGIDGWNAVRIQPFDLVITDVDMPRMNGIELVRSMRKDARLKEIPVIMVSYKDREEDKRAGIEAGADYYVTKSSFDDEMLVGLIEKLIGKSTPQDAIR